MTSSNDYQFLTRWRIKGSLEELFSVLSDPLDYPRWWPSVYLEVCEIHPGVGGIGRELFLHTKGRLPYTLKWNLKITSMNPPHGFSFTASGDFVGRGIWTFEQKGQEVELTLDWALRAEKPILKKFSAILKPLFSWNHRWAMKEGEASLIRELARPRNISAPKNTPNF